MARWKYNVSGTLLRLVSRDAVQSADVIVESGVRDEASPVCLEGIRGARTNAKGSFLGVFYTIGSDAPASVPEVISVFVRTAAGRWMPVIVPIGGANCKVVSNTELDVNVGIVAIADDQAVFREEA